MSGYKGHGTKIYYNSEEVEIITFNGEDAPSLVGSRTRGESSRLESYQQPKLKVSRSKS